MRVRYSFSSRRTGHIKNIRRQREKFPALLKKVIESSDIILEVIDSRFIEKTRNKDIEDFILNRKKLIIYVFNKFDLVDKKRIKSIDLKSLYPYVFVSCKDRIGGRQLRDKIKIESKKIMRNGIKRINVGVIGFPNTGKSSLINLLIGRKSAKTASQAGFTKGIQKLKLVPNILLLDSPGVIPQEKYSSDKQSAFGEDVIVGARNYNTVKNPDMVVASLIKEFPNIVEEYYDIKADNDSELVIEKLGRKRLILKRGNKVDIDKTSRLILKDWQEGRIKA